MFPTAHLGDQQLPEAHLPVPDYRPREGDDTPKQQPPTVLSTIDVPTDPAYPPTLAG